MATSSLRERDTVDSLDQVVRGLREKSLSTLRDHQPLLFLASLSLVVASFSQNVSEAAVSSAASASVAFMAALGLSAVHINILFDDSSDRFAVGALALISLGIGSS